MQAVSRNGSPRETNQSTMSKNAARTAKLSTNVRTGLVFAPAFETVRHNPSKNKAPAPTPANKETISSNVLIMVIILLLFSTNGFVFTRHPVPCIQAANA